MATSLSASFDSIRSQYWHTRWHHASNVSLGSMWPRGACVATRSTSTSPSVGPGRQSGPVPTQGPSVPIKSRYINVTAPPWQPHATAMTVLRLHSVQVAQQTSMGLWVRLYRLYPGKSHAHPSQRVNPPCQHFGPLPCVSPAARIIPSKNTKTQWFPPHTILPPNQQE